MFSGRFSEQTTREQQRSCVFCPHTLFTRVPRYSFSRAGVIDGFPRERFECGPWAGPARARRASLDARYGLLRRVGTIEWCRLAHLLRRLRDETDSHAMDAGLSTAQQFEM